MFATPTTKSVHTNRMLRILTTLLVAVIAILAISVSPAAAAEGPEDFLPGGNGPDDPEEPFVLVPGVIAPTTPTATVDISCTTETATVTIGNKTQKFQPITVEVDGEVHDGATVGANEAWTTTFPIAENDNALLEVLNGNNTLLAEDLHRNCLLPAPSYEILTDCGLGVATVRLNNSGDDLGHMAVQYHPNPYALQPIAAGSHLDWPLVVEPNSTVDFTIRAGHEALAVESFTFDCPIPETKPEPEVEPIPETKDEGADAEDTDVDTDDDTDKDAADVDAEDLDTDEEDNGTDAEGATDEDADPAIVDNGDDSDSDTEEALDIKELGSDDTTDEDTETALALADDDNEGGMSTTKLGLIIMWIVIAIMAAIAGALVWRRRIEEANTPLAKA